MSTKTQSLDTIFCAAIEMASEPDRAAYIEKACGDDFELRNRVEKLVAAHLRAGEFLESPVPALTATVQGEIAEGPGSAIGPYKLLEQIGEGGMGLVFVAEQQQPVKRRVALKIIKPGMDSRQVVTRFEAERQALAMMDDPHIAKIHDGGATPEGRPYFVMELVKGTPITAYCDQHRLPTRQRLQLFLDVCQAVQHAHQKGIIHRDLKPSNVLVSHHDVTPVVKVIDFGIAKATSGRLTDRTVYTAFAQMVGTPLYMSPEQAGLSDLDVDTRSDVYSLGVLLYELLTGTTPFDSETLKKAGYDELRRIIREDEPPKPSARLSTMEEARLSTVAEQRSLEPHRLSRHLRGELDWIVMKALEKDRNRRYESASALASDLQRYLSDEPVQACPPAVGYRLRKFARRNKASFATATVAALFLIFAVIGLAVSNMLIARERDAKDAARREAVSAAEAQQRAKETAEARETETKAVLEFVEGKIIGAARPKDVAGGQGYDVKLADAVKAALPFVDKSFTDKPLIEARLREMMGTSFFYLGDTKTAIEQQERARALYTVNLGPDHLATLSSMNALATCYGAADRRQEAIKLHEETLQLRKAKLGPDHPDTLTSMMNLASSYAAVGRTKEALKLREETLPLMKAKLGSDDPLTLGCMVNLASSYVHLGRFADAIKLYEEALPVMNAKMPNHPFTLNCMSGLAICYRDAGRHAEAVKLFEATLALRKAELGPDHPDTLANMGDLAIAYVEAGRAQEALKLREETLPLTKAKLGPDHQCTLMTMMQLADSYGAAGRIREAIKLDEETFQLMKAKLGPEHPETIGSMNNLAFWYLAAGEPAKAAAMLQETLNLRERRRKAEPGNSLDEAFLAWTHGQMGEAEEAQMNYSAAVQAYGRSVEMFEKLDQDGMPRDSFRANMKNYRQRLALCRKAERVLKDLDFALQQPAEEVPKLLDMRVRFLLKEQKLSSAVESAAKMKELAGDKAEQLYDAACAYAVCAGAAKNPVANASGSEKLAEEAMGLLKQAVAKGYKDAGHMKQDKDLDALRDREDFQKLVADLEAAKKP